MLRFRIRDMLWVTALAGVLVAWWLDHQRTTSECQARCTAISSYADRLKITLYHAKLKLCYAKYLLTELHVEHGGSRQDVRKQFDRISMDWSVLDEQNPYSSE